MDPVRQHFIQLETRLDEPCTKAKNIISEGILERICKVSSDPNCCLGTLIRDKIIVVPYQPIKTYIDKQEAQGEFSDTIDFKFCGNDYGAVIRFSLPSEASPPIFCILEPMDHEFPKVGLYPPISEELTVDQKIYFLSYPNDGNDPLWLKGYVCKQNEEAKVSFKVDQSALLNRVGGPVFTKKDGSLRLAGIVDAAYTSVLPSDLVSMISIGYIYEIMLRELGSELGDLQPGRGAIKGCTQRNLKGNFVKYQETSQRRHRGISMEVEGVTLPRRTYNYDLRHINDAGQKVNVHDSHIYNKNQVDLYSSAAAAFLEELERNQNQVPSVFHFNVKKNAFFAQKSL